MKEVLREDGEFLREIVQDIVQEVLEAEMDEAIGARKGERRPERKGHQSGYYACGLVTRVGKLELRVPQDRQERFSTNDLTGVFCTT